MHIFFLQSRFFWWQMYFPGEVGGVRGGGHTSQRKIPLSRIVIIEGTLQLNKRMLIRCLKSAIRSIQCTWLLDLNHFDIKPSKNFNIKLPISLSLWFSLSYRWGGFSKKGDWAFLWRVWQDNTTFLEGHLSIFAAHNWMSIVVIFLSSKFTLISIRYTVFLQVLW